MVKLASSTRGSHESGCDISVPALYSSANFVDLPSKWTLYPCSNLEQLLNSSIVALERPVVCPHPTSLADSFGPRARRIAGMIVQGNLDIRSTFEKNTISLT